MTCHHEAELLAGAFRRIDDAHDAAAMNDGDSVAKGEQVVELLGREKDAEALGALAQELTVHIVDHTDVEAEELWLRHANLE